MSAQNDIWAEAYKRNILPPEKKALFEEAMRRGLVEGPNRTLGQRFLDNVSDTFNTSWIASGFRRGYSEGASGQSIAPASANVLGTAVTEAPREIGRTLATARRYLNGGASTEAVAQDLDDLAGEAEARTTSWGDKALDDGGLPEALVYKP